MQFRGKQYAYSQGVGKWIEELNENNASITLTFPVRFKRILDVRLSDTVGFSYNASTSGAAITGFTETQATLTLHWEKSLAQRLTVLAIGIAY